jgi:hypothetical protein
MVVRTFANTLNYVATDKIAKTGPCCNDPIDVWRHQYNPMTCNSIQCSGNFQNPGIGSHSNVMQYVKSSAKPVIAPEGSYIPEALEQLGFLWSS